MLDKKNDDKKINELINGFAIEKNISSTRINTLINKILDLNQMLSKSSIKVNSKKLIDIKNVPKLIETYFDELNKLNIYNLEQTKINEIVKYINNKLIAINPDAYFDKKIFKKILNKIDESKLSIDHNIECDNEYVSINIEIKIVKKVDSKKEEFKLIFEKKINYKDDFDSSKWNFQYWKLNDFVNELKACNKWFVK